MYKIIHSDVYSGIYNLENSSIDLAITSPPYWSQRDYGFEGQIGNEHKYIDYISKLVKIFSVLKSKMSDKGVFYLNVGDKYLSKYGKSPLGLIPYKLAYFMVQDGWFLNDILIWYKPNHMPSSVKNRFTNSYEPIFVLSKNKDNYFSDFVKNNPNYSNILKINLQPSLYKHVAAYPENLVSSLLDMTLLNEFNTVLDMFAGSGTTLKVVKDYNESILFDKKLNSIMIENNLDYIEIIKKRCKIENNCVIHQDFIKYDYELIIEDFSINNLNKDEFKTSRHGFSNIMENKDDYLSFLSNFTNNGFKNKLDLNATCFIGSKNFDIDLIYNTSKLNENGWIIRNLLAIENNSKWYPVFMVIDDNKKQKNIFNYKNLDLKHKTVDSNNWSKINFIGFKVQNNLLKSRLDGWIIEIINKYDNGLPKFVYIKWENGIITKEFVINSQKEINNNIEFYFDENKNINLKEINDFIVSVSVDFLNNTAPELENKERYKVYNGKFKEEKRINWGASPGARTSNQDIYFSKQRLYEVDQK